MIFLNIYPRFIIPSIRGYCHRLCFLFPRFSNSTLPKDRCDLFRLNIDKTIISQQIPVHVQVLLKEPICPLCTGTVYTYVQVRYGTTYVLHTVRTVRTWYCFVRYVGTIIYYTVVRYVRTSMHHSLTLDRCGISRKIKFHYWYSTFNAHFYYRSSPNRPIAQIQTINS